MSNNAMTMTTTPPEAADATTATVPSATVAGAGDVAGAAVPFSDEMVIRSRTGWIAIDWKEINRFRELLYFLVWRDVKVRYKQTILGFAWAVLQPLINALIYTLIFGSAAGFAQYLPPGVPYLLFAFIGQLPWQFFSTGMSSGGLSLVNQQHLLTKIYFPRLFLPTSAIGGALFDMLMAGLVLAVFFICYSLGSSSYTPPWTIVFVPLLIIPTMIAAMAMAYTLSALTVTYRDFRFHIPIMVQIWMLMSFVMFPRELLLQRPKLAAWEWVLSLNPMYGIIQAYRGLGLGMDWNPMHLVTGTLVSIALFVFGLFYFRRTERRFADIA